MNNKYITNFEDLNTKILNSLVNEENGKEYIMVLIGALFEFNTNHVNNKYRAHLYNLLEDYVIKHDSFDISTMNDGDSAYVRILGDDRIWHESTINIIDDYVLYTYSSNTIPYTSAIGVTKLKDFNATVVLIERHDTINLGTRFIYDYMHDLTSYNDIAFDCVQCEGYSIMDAALHAKKVGRKFFEWEIK